ncbi:UNKNOWN [Stylonychia lemnae]|uniref:Uncharacterized protein n=1 Tax=Stylonychia lemnae TaxID=5949 RepID=A0A078B3B2_STYLE|nr:UNKNOWN [Stylonychia lemnae]|eukprot:CDW88751.1 UNKNOWN [Stylonychia lemnae]
MQERLFIQAQTKTFFLKEIFSQNYSLVYCLFQIPGFKTVNQNQKTGKTPKKQDDIIMDQYEKFKKQELLTDIEQQRAAFIKTKKHFSNHKFYSALPQSNFDVPVIRNASPYISQDEELRKQYLASKQNWIADKDFQTNFGKASQMTKNYIENYVIRDPSPPPINHKFRDDDKNYVGGPFILYF